MTDNQLQKLIMIRYTNSLGQKYNRITGINDEVIRLFASPGNSLEEVTGDRSSMPHGYGKSGPNDLKSASHTFTTIADRCMSVLWPVAITTGGKDYLLEMALEMRWVANPNALIFWHHD